MTSPSGLLHEMALLVSYFVQALFQVRALAVFMSSCTNKITAPWAETQH